MSPESLVYLFLLLIDVVSKTAASANRLSDIYWNSTNPIFRIDNTDHIIDVNKNNIPFEYDQVNIICPVYTPGTHEEDAEKYIIYNVSKEEYDTCRITNPNPRIIAVCDKPYKLMYFTITFRSFTPQPGGLEFRPGQDYYFISTSSREDLHRRIGGRCSTHNMKVVFKVCCKPEDLAEKLSTAGRPVLASSTTTTTTTVSTIGSNNIIPVMNSTTPAPTTTTTTVATSTTRIVPHWKDIETQSYSIRTTTKKSEAYDILSNEVVKNEELSSKASGASRLDASLSRHLASPFWCLLVLLVLSRLR